MLLVRVLHVAVRVDNPCACTAEQPYTMLLVCVLAMLLVLHHVACVSTCHVACACTACRLCVYCMLLVRVNNPCACTACCLCVWTTLVRVLHVACACGQPLCVYCMLLVCVLLDNINPTPHKNTHTHIYRVGHNHIDTVYIR